MISVAEYQRIFGDELRRRRKRRGWTRKDLRDRMTVDISLQTLATYELGTRQCAVSRFVEICLALGELPHEVMAAVHARAYPDSPVSKIRIDLNDVVRSRQPQLYPLRRWAHGKLDEDHTTEVELDIAALENMARLCGLETVALIGMLREIRGSPNTHCA